MAKATEEKKAGDTLEKMGITLEPDIDTKEDPIPEQQTTDLAEPPKPKQYEIIIDEQDNWDQNTPVKGSVNGVAFNLPRGKPIVVSAGVVNNLNTRIMTLYEPTKDGARPRHVRRFAFRILREIY